MTNKERETIKNELYAMESASVQDLAELYDMATANDDSKAIYKGLLNAYKLGYMRGAKNGFTK